MLIVSNEQRCFPRGTLTTHLNKCSGNSWSWAACFAVASALSPHSIKALGSNQLANWGLSLQNLGVQSWIDSSAESELNMTCILSCNIFFFFYTRAVKNAKKKKDIKMQCVLDICTSKQKDKLHAEGKTKSCKVIYIII